jgi:hypothetical protein
MKRGEGVNDKYSNYAGGSPLHFCSFKGRLSILKI